MIFKNVRLYNGDIILIKNKDVPPEEQKKFMKALESMARFRFMVMFVDEFEDVKALTLKELEQMREWARKSE